MPKMQQFPVKKRQDCHVAIAPCNDIAKTFFVIEGTFASLSVNSAKQSDADAGSPGIAAIKCVMVNLPNHLRH